MQLMVMSRRLTVLSIGTGATDAVPGRVDGATQRNRKPDPRYARPVANGIFTVFYSIFFYTIDEEIDRLMHAIEQVRASQ